MFRTAARGFGLLEVLVVLGVMLLLVSVILYSLGNFRNKEALNGDVQGVAAVLEEARELTLSGKEASNFGVHFQSDRVVRFKGAVYNPNDPANLVMVLDSLVAISQIALTGAGTETVFAKLTGEVNAYGTITISLAANPVESKTVRISKTGLVIVE